MKGKDILQNATELKQNPFRIPEGYFSEFKAEMKAHPGLQAQPESSRWNKFAPYISLAAAFVILVTAGTFILKQSAIESTSYEDDIVAFGRLIPETDPEYIFYSNSSQDELSKEDIIEYLIFSGISAESIEID